MHGLMIAIDYSYKLDRKNYFNLWCELGRLLFRQSHIVCTCMHTHTHIQTKVWWHLNKIDIGILILTSYHGKLQGSVSVIF